MANTFAMTALLILLGLAGNSSLAADVGIVQGATLALFYAFSANARNLILNRQSPVSAESVMLTRLWLMTPLAGAAYWLSVKLAGVEPLLAVILILRRCVEWLDEVFLSEMECLDARKNAKTYLLLQCVLLLFALGWTLAKLPFPLLGLSSWALLPLLFSGRFYAGMLPRLKKVSLYLSEILPHLGSTVIIGVTVYVFRLLIVLMAGKNTAGDLFTAFAIGGVIGSVFANALGPSLVLHQARQGTRKLPFLLQTALVGSLAGGSLIFACSAFDPGILGWTGKTPYFWQATGLSMIGGVVMVYAQMIRHRLLQHHKDRDLFGPDVLMNILIIVSIPFLKDLFGLQALEILYLYNSLLALVFYWSYQKEEHLNRGRSLLAQHRVRTVIAVLIVVPVFFQLSHGIFDHPSMKFKSEGIFRLLPIPVSVLACYGGILLLAEYRRAFVSLTYIFFTCLLMVGTTIAASRLLNAEVQAKFILLIQFILPMFGFVLGQLFEIKDKPELPSLEKAFFYTVAAVVPLQLICTWLQGYQYLSPYLYLFSIYQHLQYVPVVFTAAFLLALCRLWQWPAYRKGLLALALLMSIYVAASVSTLAIALLLAGVAGFAGYQWKNDADKIPAVLALILALSSWSYLQYEKESIKFKYPGLTAESATEADNILPNVSQRVFYWQYYAKNSLGSIETFLTGHMTPPDRHKYPSAHNYYLDVIYNFGFLALVPMLSVLVYTLNLIYRLRREIVTSPAMSSLCAVVLFLLLIDNSLKVSLRQPYSGIFSFFVWGVLVSRLAEIHATKLGKPDAAPGGETFAAQLPSASKAQGSEPC